MHRVAQPILLQIVLSLNFDGILLIRVNLFVLGWFLLLPLGLGVEQNGLRVASERQRVELIGVVFVEQIEGWQLLELEIVLAG